MAAPVRMCLENGAHRLLYTARKDAISPHQPFGPRRKGDMITVAGYNASLHPEGLRWTQPRHSIPLPSRRYWWAASMGNLWGWEGGHRLIEIAYFLPPRVRYCLAAAAGFCT